MSSPDLYPNGTWVHAAFEPRRPDQLTEGPHPGERAFTTLPTWRSFTEAAQGDLADLEVVSNEDGRKEWRADLDGAEERRAARAATGRGGT